VVFVDCVIASLGDVSVGQSSLNSLIENDLNIVPLLLDKLGEKSFSRYRWGRRIELASSVLLSLVGSSFGLLLASN